MTDITDLAEELYANARAKGFYDHEDWLRKEVRAGNGMPEGIERNDRGEFMKALTEHFGNRLMLIAGEAVEAHEELRSGRGVAELYFSGMVLNNVPVDSRDAYTEMGKLLKPEGVLAELADIAIRTLETMTSILQLASDEEKAKLRAQVPQNEATEISFAGDGSGESMAVENVNAAEIIIMKHDFNQQRAQMNGGRKF